MAKDLGVSKYVLSRVFSKTFHRNFNQYLNDARLVGNIFQQLYTIADTMIVGRVIGVEALAAVGAADWLVFGSYIFCMCTDLQSRDWEIPGFLLSVELLSLA